MANKVRVRASDILANFTRNVPDSRAVVRRLNVMEHRKREEENAKSLMIDSIRKLTNKGAEAERKFSLAKKGGFEGNFWRFLMNPETSQMYYETGIDKTRAGEIPIEDSLLEKVSKESGGLSQIGQGLNELLNPLDIAQPDMSISALGTLNPIALGEEMKL